MPRQPSGKVLLRHEAESFSIVDVGAEGLLRQRQKSAGFLIVRGGDEDEVTGFIPVLATIGDLDGTLRLYKPWEHDIVVQAGIRSGASGPRVWWSLVCPGKNRWCGRLCRTLYRPAREVEDHLFTSFACKRCWHLRFPNARELAKRARDSTRDFKSELLRMREEIDRLLQIPDL